MPPVSYPTTNQQSKSKTDNKNFQLQSFLLGGLSGMVLTSLVVGLALSLSSTNIPKSGASVQNQTTIPVTSVLVSPSLTITPTLIPTTELLTTKPVVSTENWKSYTNSSRGYSIKYPTNIQGPKVYGASNNDEAFFEVEYSFTSLNFTVSEGSTKAGSNNSTNNVIGRLSRSLFSSKPGVITDMDNPSGSNYSNETVTKLSDLVINGYNAVEFEDNYAGSPQQPTQNSKGYMIKKNNDYYYAIIFGYYTDSNLLNQNSDKISQIAKSFKIL